MIVVGDRRDEASFLQYLKILEAADLASSVLSLSILLFRILLLAFHLVGVDSSRRGDGNYQNIGAENADFDDTAV